MVSQEPKQGKILYSLFGGSLISYGLKWDGIPKLQVEIRRRRERLRRGDNKGRGRRQ